MIKPVIFCILFIFSGFTTYAQLSKTVECTAGNLSSLISTAEISKITSLTVKGTMDARDFYTIRFKMTLLSDIDLSEVTVEAYTGTEANPGQFNIAYPANEIPKEAFIYRYKLKSVILPSSVTSIGSKAFYDCQILTSIKLPSSLLTIGVSAFEQCYALPLIEIPASVTKISSQAFDSCYELGYITIPNSVSSIGYKAFANCGVINLRLPSSLTKIENGTFSFCTKMKSIYIPPSVTSIGSDAFEYCYNLTSIYIPSAVTSIGRSAFSNCGFSSVNIPNSVTFLDENVFYECMKLTSVNIPTSLTSLSYSLFEGCRQLTSLTIPSTITSLNFSALNECFGLTSLYCLSVNPPPAIGSPTIEIPYTTCTLFVPKGSKEAYSSTYPWNDFKNIVEIDGLYLSTHTARVPSNGGTVKVDVICSNEWSVTSDADWLIKTKEAGRIHISIPSNPTGVKRSGILTVSSAGLADQTITITQDAGITAIDETENPEIVIFPNPATTMLYIKGINHDVKVSVFDLYGKMVIQKNCIDHLIDISDLCNGIYTIRIADKNTLYSKKFVKQSH